MKTYYVRVPIATCLLVTVDTEGDEDETKRLAEEASWRLSVAGEGVELGEELTTGQLIQGDVHRLPLVETVVDSCEEW